MKIDKIINKLILVILPMLMAIGSNSCRDDEFLLGNVDYDKIDGLPVEIEAFLPETLSTRIFEDVKTSFEKGELIHIVAEFNCVNNGEEYKLRKYAAMTFQGKGSWTPFNADTGLSWPGDAVSATFSAYFIPGSNGILSSQTMEPKLLNSYTYADDPLEAHAVNVPYGHTVGFNFTHLFAHLTLFDLQVGISDRFWLTREEGGVNKLNNAFHIEYDPVATEIKPVFSAIGDEKYGGMVYLTSNMIMRERDEEDVAEVNYFIEPGLYDDFQVRYPRTSSQASTYLTYRSTGSSGAKYLHGNGRYEFSVLRSLGIVTVEKPGTGWDETTEPFVVIDVEKFLKAANAGLDYFEEDPNTGELVHILLATDSGTELLRNVDFQFKYYEVFPANDTDPEFIPNMSKTFDGGYHYIYNIGCPLFHDNTGAIKNVGIRTGSTKGHPLESNERYPVNGHTEDFSRQGMIARINHGTVNNLRISDLDMTVKIQTTNEELPDQEAHNAGLLFGTNLGYIYDISLSGNFSLTVENADGETIMPTVSMGGITGQNLSYISNISPLEGSELSLTINNKCNGPAGVYIIGGVAGNQTGYIYDVLLPKVDINSGESVGQHSYIGGLVGRIAETTGDPATLASSAVKGEVTAGKSSSAMGIISNSYTGGLVGYMNIQGIITNCSSSCSVAGPTVLSQGAVYATGGAFGRIVRTEGVIEGNIQTVAAFGEKLEGQGYLGCFSGIVPVDYDWNYFSSKQNTVKKYRTIDYIGASLSQ